MNTLKLGIKLLLISLSGLFIISCSSKDDIYEQLTPQRLDIRTAIASTYSLDKQYFSSGDHIGVYLVDYINNQPGVLGDIANSSKNIRHTLEGSKWVADAGKEIMLYSTISDIYAYYPYDMEMGKIAGKLNLAAYPFSVKSDQQAAVSESDFLWAKAAGLSNTNNRANLTFKHLLSKLVINLHYNDDLTSDLNFRIHNTLTSSTINLRNGQATAVGNKRIVYPAKNPATENGFELKYEAILIPQAIKAGTPLFSITIDDYILTYAIDQDLELLPQTSYIFNLSIGEAKKTLSPSLQLLNMEVKRFE